MENTALITGASCGIGKFLAVECAKRNFNLLLVALPDTGLDLVKRCIENRYKIKVLNYEADLTQPEVPANLYKFCKQHDISVRLLINNAGIGYEDAFDNLSLEFCEQLMLLNTYAVVALTRLFLYDLKQQPSAYILNVSSLASFTPMPFKTIYAASKSFIYSFSRALQRELLPCNLHVSVLCPGPVPTNAVQLKRIALHGWMAKFASIEPAQLAKVAMHQLFRKEKVIIPGTLNNINRVLMAILPVSFQMWLLSRAYKRALA